MLVGAMVIVPVSCGLAGARIICVGVQSGGLASLLSGLRVQRHGCWLRAICSRFDEGMQSRLGVSKAQ
jgi:hypothetical protein